MEEQSKPAAKPANAYAQVHEVVKGDTLGKIAAKYYGGKAA